LGGQHYEFRQTFGRLDSAWACGGDTDQVAAAIVAPAIQDNTPGKARLRIRGRGIERFASEDRNLIDDRVAVAVSVNKLGCYETRLVGVIEPDDLDGEEAVHGGANVAAKSRAKEPGATFKPSGVKHEATADPSSAKSAASVGITDRAGARYCAEKAISTLPELLPTTA
jgi:hypothetical protein